MRIGLFLLVLVLSGCSSILQEPDDSSRSVTAVIPPREEPKVTRSLGSLWSNSSAWNSVYSATTSRIEGDLLEIQLTESIKNRIQALRQKMIFEKYGEGAVEMNAQKPAVAPAASDPNREPANENAPDSIRQVAVDPLPSTLQAVIKDVGQRGLYKISALETLRVGEDEPRLTVEGLVRDRDIDSDDKLSGDSIYGLKIELGTKTGQNETDSQKARREGNGNVSW